MSWYSPAREKARGTGASTAAGGGQLLEPLEARCLLSTVFWEHFEGSSRGFLQDGWTDYSNTSNYHWSENNEFRSDGFQSLFAAGFGTDSQSFDSRNYPNNLNTQFWRFVDLSQFDGGTLSFDAYWDLQADHDFIKLKIGSVEVWNETDWSGGWRRIDINMDRFAPDSNVLIHFLFTSDNENTGSNDPGVWIDNIRLEMQEQPDLEGQVFNVEPETGLESGRLITQLDFRIKNSGSVAVTESFVVRFILSTDNRFGANDKLLGAMVISDDFAPGQSRGYTRDNVMRLPHAEEWLPYTGTGTYFIGMIVDYRNWVREANEGNNRNHAAEGIDWDAVRIEVVERGDLRGAQFDIHDQALNAGQEISVIWYSIDNIGMGTIAQSFAVRFYLSTDNKFGFYDYFLGGVQINRVFEQGQQKDFSTLLQGLTLRLPNAGAWRPFHGTSVYYVGMIIDFWNNVPELNENNNKNRGEYLDFERLIIVLPDPRPDRDPDWDSDLDDGGPGGVPDGGDGKGFEVFDNAAGLRTELPGLPTRTGGRSGGATWEGPGLLSDWRAGLPDVSADASTPTASSGADHLLLGLGADGRRATPQTTTLVGDTGHIRLWRLDDPWMIDN